MAETFFYLTTTGRKTGKPHKIEIWYVEHEDCFYLCSGGGTSADWVKNIQANPAVEFYMGTSMAQRPKHQVSGTARVLDQEGDEELRQQIRELFLNKYKWGTGLFVQICHL